MGELLEDLSAQIRSLRDRRRPERAPPQVYYRKEFFGARFLGGAPDNPQHPARPHPHRPRDLSFRGLILRRPRANGHFPRADRRISPLSRRVGTGRHTRIGRSGGHEVPKHALTVIDTCRSRIPCLIRAGAWVFKLLEYPTQRRRRREDRYFSITSYTGLR